MSKIKKDYVMKKLPSPCTAWNFVFVTVDKNYRFRRESNAGLTVQHFVPLSTGYRGAVGGRSVEAMEFKGLSETNKLYKAVSLVFEPPIAYFE